RHRELDDLDLGSIDAILLQDDLEQIDVGLGLADHTDLAPRKLADLGDLRTRLLAPAFGWWRPQDHKVLAQRGDGLRIFRHLKIAANDRKVDLALRQRLRARHRAVGRNRFQADIGLVLHEGLRQSLHYLDVIAVGGADPDPQRD